MNRFSRDYTKEGSWRGFKARFGLINSILLPAGTLSIIALGAFLGSLWKWGSLTAWTVEQASGPKLSPQTGVMGSLLSVLRYYEHV
ncbi:Protein of unknown function [Pyronema omphalodes CBS 100304]|uniref:Uncharacterized protein n=1 Tax=Pyronema omphalodes (strain CBS 100304) TaxID=1076935 RepID=U4L8V7_PYROM|nr:Protein of unknown function [Pyronema omphalodes CBS 100304]